MKICILDYYKKMCVQVLYLDSPEHWTPAEGLEIANNHSGEVGLILTDSGWVQPTSFWEDLFYVPHGNQSELPLPQDAQPTSNV